MCPRCHAGLDDGKALQDLKDILDNPQYDLWNETSLSHLAICLSGYNGDEVSILADRIFNDYISWKKDHPSNEDGSFFGNPTVIKTNFYKSVGLKTYNLTRGMSKEDIMLKYHEVYNDHLDMQNTCVIS